MKPAAATGDRQRRFVALNTNGNRVGECHPNAKLSDADCDLIHALREGGMKLSAIADKFGVKKAAIWKIIQRLRRSQTPERWIEMEVLDVPATRPASVAPRKPYRKKEESALMVNHAAVDLQRALNAWR